ncbi:OmpA family protein [Pseudovibrio ascidiaceicola]|uniref:Outer membrane protein OmpA n=1 Tax=Pseudovibrio ascidiaceicola TaxID=285279 RepID=A0A1I3W3M2_9HYPH|nr:OmpA family protein [Pseudovibrio ascidiaceicola]SFK01031.1 Outer membrane protein OmpA [Pseudovibrio ascidiaceicola]
MKNILGSSPVTEDSEWVSVSDLMAGLMVIFLFIAVVYLRPLVEAKEQAIQDKEVLTNTQDTIKQIVVAWHDSEVSIYEALEAEFKDDLETWNAELEQETLTLRFKAPEVLFRSNEASLRPEFRRILADFFPRYMTVLNRFQDTIEEIRIEGHTSSEWGRGTPKSEAYFNNMALSQERTRAVLEYSIMLTAVRPFREWAFKHVTANGLSSSHTIQTETGFENARASRRVEFRVRTTTKDQIIKVIETIQ